MLGNKTEGLAHIIHKNITSQYTNEEFTKKILVCWIIKVASKSILVCASKFYSFNGRAQRWNVQLNKKSKRGIIPETFLLSIIRNWFMFQWCFEPPAFANLLGKTPTRRFHFLSGFFPETRHETENKNWSRTVWSLNLVLADTLFLKEVKMFKVKIVPK